MKIFMAILGGAIVGASAGMLLAPQSGAATRSMIKDKANKYSHDAKDFVDGKMTHMGNKLEGIKHQVSGMMGRSADMTEEDTMTPSSTTYTSLPDDALIPAT